MCPPRFPGGAGVGCETVSYCDAFLRGCGGCTIYAPWPKAGRGREAALVGRSPASSAEGARVAQVWAL